MGAYSYTGMVLPNVAGYTKEKIWHASQEIFHQQDDGSIIFEADVAGTDENKFWIMNWGSHALNLDPKYLRSEIKTEAEVMVGKYAEGYEIEGLPHKA
ncbi:MAG: WYL domain-containing protein [Deltaproteobacteria bacterium]|nr:WYL domain-containing protein [Deltaproteobacteria bacterium]